MERPRKAFDVHGTPNRTIRCAARAVAICAILLVGHLCSSLRAQQVLPEPHARQIRLSPSSSFGDPVGTPCGTLAWPVIDPLANLALAGAELAAGIEREKERQEACVDFFYRSAVRAWRILECATFPSAMTFEYQAAWHTYQQSLARLIPAASRFGRLDPRSHLIIHGVHRRYTIRTAYYGAPWRPMDFCEVIPAAEFQGRDLRRYYQAPGLGASFPRLR